MNKLTLAASCDGRVGRANIEESNGRVDGSSRRPQASYPRGNFSDTSTAAKLVRGSLGHAFARQVLAGHQAQAHFCPYALREVSLLAEWTFGRLRCDLVGVPPQPSIPPARVPLGDQGRDLRVGIS